MKNVIHGIGNRFAAMTPAEKAVAKYVMERPDEVILLSMKSLAEKVNVSDNSVLRFCRTCGYSGYLDFKTALLPGVITQTAIYHQLNKEDGFALRKQKVLGNIVSTVQQTCDAVQEDAISTVARRIAASTGTAVVGLAGSAGVSLIFSDSLLSMGILSVGLSDRVEIERYCACMDECQVLVGFSASGETQEVLMAIERARGNGAFTVLISNNIAVKGDSHADVFLFTQIPPEDIAGTFFALPRIAQLSLAELVLSEIPSFLPNRDKRLRGVGGPLQE